MPGSPFKRPARPGVRRPRPSTPSRPRTSGVKNPSQLAGGAKPSPSVAAKAAKVRVTSKARSNVRMPAVKRVKPPQ